MAGQIDDTRALLATLRRYLQTPRTQQEERCELCSEPIPPEHRHLVEVSARRILCVCRACSILFDQDAASSGRYRLVPDRYLHLVDFDLSDMQWAGLQIPVDMAFFFHSTPAGRVVAFYPGPLGPTESLLELEEWEQLQQRNPVLATLKPDVEALLINRSRSGRGHYLVPIDACYRLTGLIRMHWKGLSGGREVWQEIDRFFEGLDSTARPATRDGHIRPRTTDNVHAANGGD